MLVKLYNIIDRRIYKRHLTPERPKIICEVYNCKEGNTHNESSKVCLGCDIPNRQIDNLYGNYIDSWDTKFCYTYYDDNKESSDNKG